MHLSTPPPGPVPPSIPPLNGGRKPRSIGEGERIRRDQDYIQNFRYK